MKIPYDKYYYDVVYKGFDDAKFAHIWGLGCAIACGYAQRKYNAVLEFGAGLGQNLANVEALTKWAVDVSDTSKVACEKQNFIWGNSLKAVPYHYFDMILSRHSLEHVMDPLRTLRLLKNKAAPNCVFYLIVPLERSSPVSSVRDFDNHRHLFSWTPETLKNLLVVAGWTIDNIRINNNMFFRKSLWLLPRNRTLFLRLRQFISRYLPLKSAEIVATCHREE